MHPLFEDYLDRIKVFHDDFAQTIAGLPQEALDWTPGTEMNSLAMLIMHATGSARYWVGDICLEDESRRDRDAEFRVRGMDEMALRKRLDETTRYMESALERLSLDELAEIRSAPGRDQTYRIGYALLHALEHTGLHLGQAQMTRQLWDQHEKQA